MADFLSYYFSISVFFILGYIMVSGYQLEGIFVGIWVPSILILSVVIRQRVNDYKNEINNKS